MKMVHKTTHQDLDMSSYTSRCFNLLSYKAKKVNQGGTVPQVAVLPKEQRQL